VYVPFSFPSDFKTKGVALCASNQLNPQNYTTKYPRLVAKAGERLVANYTENGHVTQDKLPPDNKPHPGNYSWVSHITNTLLKL
jgi:hypothetical protein